MNLFDSHCHLDFDQFADLEGVLGRAFDVGVRRATTIGTGASINEVRRAHDIAMRGEVAGVQLFCSAGVHPHDAASWSDDDYDALAELVHAPKVVAVGEMGLDYYYDNSPRESQQASFRRQIALARDVKKPIIVHTRDAGDDTLRVLREESARDVGGIIHCFSEDYAFAKAALDLGFVSSFSGIVTFPKRTEGIQEAAEKLPLDSVLIETDAPFLSPIPKRGRENEPAHVQFIADFIAKLRKIAPEKLREVTFANASRVYQLPA